MYKGYSGAIQGKEKRLPLRLGVIAIEKGVSWSLSTLVANVTLLIINIYVYTYINMGKKEDIEENQIDIFRYKNGFI